MWTWTGAFSLSLLQGGTEMWPAAVTGWSRSDCRLVLFHILKNQRCRLNTVMVSSSSELLILMFNVQQQFSLSLGKCANFSENVVWLLRSRTLSPTAAHFRTVPTAENHQPHLHRVERVLWRQKINLPVNPSNSRKNKYHPLRTNRKRKELQELWDSALVFLQRVRNCCKSDHN